VDALTAHAASVDTGRVLPLTVQLLGGGYVVRGPLTVMGAYHVHLQVRDER
jgi:hypothetical protein